MIVSGLVVYSNYHSMQEWKETGKAPLFKRVDEWRLVQWFDSLPAKRRFDDWVAEPLVSLLLYRGYLKIPADAQCLMLHQNGGFDEMRRRKALPGQSNKLEVIESRHPLQQSDSMFGRWLQSKGYVAYPGGTRCILLHPNGDYRKGQRPKELPKLRTAIEWVLERRAAQQRDEAQVAQSRPTAQHEDVFGVVQSHLTEHQGGNGFAIVRRGPQE